MTADSLAGRLGGLAAALGAGVVIGLASSAPASADAADPAPSAPASETPGGNSAPASRRAPTRPRPVRVANREHPAAKRVSAGRPAAAATPIARAATRPVPSPVPVRPAAAGPAAVGPAPAPAAPAAESVGALLCDPRGQKIRVFKGTHVALPLNTAFFTKKVTGSATFTPDTAYDLGDVDQYDWNKLTGIAFSPLQHDRNSAMVGWRYNLNTEEFEIAPFYNVDKKRILPNELTEVISVPADQAFTYTVDYHGITVSYGDTTVYKPYPEGLKPVQLTASRVSGWFGGNEVAPRTVSYYLKLKRL